MTPKLLLFSTASLLLASTYALPRSMNGNGNGNGSLNAIQTEFCTFQLLFQPFQWNVRLYDLTAEGVEWEFARTE